MSQSIMIKNDNYCVMTSDSLVNELIYNNKEEKWINIDQSYQRKVFYNTNKKIIYTIVGCDLSVINIHEEINKLNIDSLEILSEELKKLHFKIKSHLQFADWKNAYIDSKILLCFSINNCLYQCLIISSSNKCPVFNQISFIYQPPLSITIGSYADIFQNKVKQPSNKDGLSMMLNESINHIKDVIKYDNTNKRFDYQVVGGDIYSVSMDKEGKIKTFINEEENVF